MVEHNPPSPGASARVPVIPLPIALDVSDGLVFEFYDGGQPRRSSSIRCERLGLCSFVAVRALTASGGLIELVAQALNGNHREARADS
jgi:hypothetical protein